MDNSCSIPFIIFDNKHGFVVTNEAKEFLNSLGDKKLGIISVIGKYRTGKSYFINKILLNLKKENGFKVSETTNACTKGIWIWNQTIKKEDTDIEYLVCDTEGLGSINEGTNHDTRIFLFALLLSSFFIYNSLGAIDENALNNLFLIINIAKEIRIKGENESEDVSEYFPSFLWILRDFALKLVDDNGYEITPKQYLENTLEAVNGISDHVEEKNKIKRMIKNFFKDRDCFTMVRPVKDETLLAKLDQVNDNELRPEFFKQINYIRQRIYKKTKPKTLNGKILDGVGILKLAESYAESINKGKVVTIQNAWNYLCHNENEKIMIKLKEVFRNELLKNIEELDNDKIEILKTKMLIEFQNTYIKSDDNEDDLDQLKEEFDKILNEELEEIWKKYQIEIIDKGNNFLEENYHTIKIDILNNNDIPDNINDLEKYFNPLFIDFKNNFKLSEILYNKIIDDFKNKKIKEVMGWIYSQKNKKEKMIKNELDNKLNTLENELSLIRNKNDKINKEMIDKEKDLNNENKNLKKNNKNYEKEINSWNDKYNIDIKNSQIQIENLINENNLLKKENYDLKKEKENNNKIINDEMKKKISDFEKSQALKIQELKFLKTENNNLRSVNDNNSKELSNLKSNNLLNLKEIDTLNKQIKLLNKESKNKENKLNDKKNTELQSEISVLKSKNKMIKEQLEDIRKVNNNLLNNISSKITNIESNTKNKEEDKLNIDENKYKILKKMIKYASAMTCANCNDNIQNPLFSNHLEYCLKKVGSNENIQTIFKENFQINIIKTIISENTETGMPCSNFIIEIFNNKFKWEIHKKMYDFFDLIDNIQEKYPELELPLSVKKVDDMVNNLEILLSGKCISVSDRKNILENCLRDLIKIKEVRNTRLFENFLGVNKSK